MSTSPDFRSSQDRSGRLLRAVPALIFLLSVIVLLVVPTLYAREYPKSAASVFDDVVTLGRLSCLVGFISDLGIVLWFAMSLLCLHALHRAAEGGYLTKSDATFFGGLAVLTAWLGLDDRLLIHEWLNEKQGVSEIGLMALYVVAAAGYGWKFRDKLRSAGTGWLWVAVPCFVLSLAVDLGFLPGFFHNANIAWEVVEESLKWLGIVALFLYVFVLTARAPSSHPSEKTQ